MPDALIVRSSPDGKSVTMSREAAVQAICAAMGMDSGQTAMQSPLLNAQLKRGESLMCRGFTYEQKKPKA